MTSNVNNTGIDKVKSYLQGLGVDTSKLTQAQMQSIFAQADGSGDGKITQSEFSAAVSDVLGTDLDALTAAEDEFLAAWEEIAGADGDKETISEEDLKELGLEGTEGTDAAETPDSPAGPAGPGGGGPKTPEGNGQGAGEGVQPANITGNETAAELNKAKADQLSQLDTVRAGEAMKAAHTEMNSKEEGYKDALKALEEQAGEHKEELAALNEKRKLAEEAVDKHESEVVAVAEQTCAEMEDAYNTAKTNKQTAQTNLNSAKSEVSALQGSEPPTEIQVGTTEDGEPIMGPNPDHATWVENLAAAEEKVTEAEAALEEAEKAETSAKEDVEKAQQDVEEAQEALVGLQEEVTAVDEEIAQFMLDTGLAETEAGLAVTQALGDYTEAKNAYDAAQQQRNADMQTLRDNIHAYDEAIDKANAKEKEEADAKYEAGKAEREETLADAKKSEYVTEEDEECVADPIGFEFEDADGNKVDLKLVTDDGDFDSVSDFLGTANGGIQALTSLDGDGDGIVTAQELSDGGIKFASVVDGKATALSFDEIKQMYGVDSIEIDISKIDNNYEGDQNFDVKVGVGTYDKKTGTVTDVEQQEITGYSTYQTADEIKAMEGYEEIGGDYQDTNRYPEGHERAGELVTLPDYLQGTEYAKYIDIDENGNFYVNVDVAGADGLTFDADDNGQETLDEIISTIYNIDITTDEGKEQLAYIKTGIKVANASEENDSLYISGAKGTINSNKTEDGAKLLLVDPKAAEELVGPESEWYKKSEGNYDYRNWATDAAKETDLARSLTANQGYTLDSEGKKVLDPAGEEFNQTVDELTNGVVDEDGNVVKTPEEVWAETDLSQYSAETVLEMAKAFEQRTENADTTFFDTAQYYCGDGKGTNSTSNLEHITESIVSKAGNDIDALEMVTRELQTSIESGDKASLDSIDRILNAANKNQLDMQSVLKYSSEELGFDVAAELEKLTDLAADKLEDYKNIIADCENAQDNSDAILLARKLGSTNDKGELSGVAEQAWKDLDIASMTPAQVAELQEAYDSEFGTGAFEAKVAEVYPPEEDTYAQIMNSIDPSAVDPSVDENTTLEDGTKIGDFIDNMAYASGIRALGELSSEDVNNVAAVYDQIHGDGAFNEFMANQTEFEPSKGYEISQQLETAKAEAEAAAAEGNYTITEDGKKQLIVDGPEFTEVVDSLVNDNKAWDEIDFSEYDDTTIANIALAYNEAMGDRQETFLDRAANMLKNDEYQQVVDSLMISSVDNKEINKMLMSKIETELAEGDSRTINTVLAGDPASAQAFLNNNPTIIDSIKNSNLPEDDKTALIDRVETIQTSTILTSEEQELLDKLLAGNDHAWSEISPDMDAATLAKFATEYDAIYGEGAFLEEAQARFGEENNTYDNIMNKLNEATITDFSDIENATIAGKPIEEFVDGLGERWDLHASTLENLTADELAMIEYYIGEDEFQLQMDRAFETTDYSIIADKIDSIADANTQANYDSKIGEKVDYLKDGISDIHTAIEETAGLDEKHRITDGEERIHNMINTVMTDTTLTESERFDILVELSQDPSVGKYVSSYLQSDFGQNYANSKIMQEMFDNCRTPEDALKLGAWYQDMMSAENSTENVFDGLRKNGGYQQIVSLYENATPSEIAQLNEMFNIPELLDDAIANNNTWANQYIATITANANEAQSGLSTAGSEEAYKDQYFDVGFEIISLKDNKREVAANIYAGINAGLPKETAIWLINEYAKEVGVTPQEMYKACAKENPEAFLALFEE